MAITASSVRLWNGGYAGLSNDDAARLLIASAQAQSLTLDPTRSSWLPAHAWLLALSVRLHPHLLDASRAASLASAIVACVCAGVALRARGASPSSSAWTLLLLALWPWSALSAASGGIPEMPCVALVMAATATLEGPPSLLRAMAAGLLLSLAEGHRYEAWWAAGGLCCAHALRHRRPVHAATLALGCALMPLFWLALNASRHGDPLEFVHRVEAFRAHDGPLPSALARLSRYPRLLVTESPALLLLAALGLRSRDGRVDVVAPGAVLLALVWGDLRGGGPTHHPGRALLLAAWLSAPLIERGIARLLASPRKALSAAALALGLAFGLRRDPARGSSVDPETLAAGDAVRRTLATKPQARWMIDLDRQDFLWVEVRAEAFARCVPDRLYGAAPPDRASLRALSRGVSLACVARRESVEVLLEEGFTVASRIGSWTLLTRLPSGRDQLPKT